MNNISISPYIALHALQMQNIKRNVAKKIDVSEKIKLEISEIPDETPDKIVAQNNPTEEIKL